MSEVAASAAQTTLQTPMQTQDFLVCFVNGKKHEIHARDFKPESTLLHFLRQGQNDQPANPCRHTSAAHCNVSTQGKAPSSERLNMHAPVCGLSGTKLVCGEGGCGACTVLVSKLDHSSGLVRHLSVNACLYPLGAVDGAHVITIEGIGNPRIGLHPIQVRLAELNGSQCGFCTPGIAMAFYALVRNNPTPTQHEIEHVMDGNLCRCTGYRPILDATKSFAVDRSNGCGMGENCCRNRKADVDVAAVEEKVAALSCTSSAPQCSGMQVHSTCTCSKIADLAGATPPTPLPQAFREDSALIFPPFLRKYQPTRIVLATSTPRTSDSNSTTTTWTKPSNLADLLTLKAAHPDAKLVCGNTEAGIDLKFRFDSRPWAQMVYAADVPELRRIVDLPTGVELGASTTINTLQTMLKRDLDTYDASSRTLAQAILSQIQWFAGTQIRNVASVAGNICTASPISDLNPVWQAASGVRMRVAKAGRAEDRFIDGKDFFTGYRRTAMEQTEVLVSIFIPLQKSTPTAATTDAVVYTHAYKQSRRRADDIAIVTACMQMSLEVREGSVVFRSASLSYGGMAPATALAHKTAAFLVGRPATLETIQSAQSVLRQDFPLLDAAVLPGGMAEYRMVLAASFLLKMFYFVWREAKSSTGNSAISDLLPAFPAEAESATREYEREVSSGSQTYRVRRTQFAEEDDVKASASSSADEKVEEKKSLDAHGPSAAPKRKDSDERNLVGDPSATVPAQSGEALRHLSALKQASGEAKYLDDTRLVPDGLHAGLVLSTEAHARIVSIDTSAAEAAEGFGGFWCAKDVPGSNEIGDMIHDEELFASEFVTCVGATIGIVVARTQVEAWQIARLVKVTYEKLPAIFTIDEAIEAKSFIAPWQEGHTIVSGDVEAALASAPHIIEGEARIGGQEHFYLETMQMECRPGEGDAMEVTGTTQNPNKAQQYVARVLGIGAHQVVCTVKRMGGGFGGKESRSLHLTAAAAIAARHTGRTVRLVLDRDVDMATTGQRHAFLGKYRVGFDDKGRLLGSNIQLFANAGCSADLTMGIVDRALTHVDNAYRLGACRLVGTPCRTNLPSNTAFRGFGGPQGMFVAECIMDAVARYLRIRPEVVRAVNLYVQGDRTPYTQELKEYTVPEQFAHVKATVDLDAKRAAIDAFNAKNKHVKRGLALMPTKFGIAFGAKFLNQAGALVMVYSDGTVLINHGGTEMGQGLHTKMCQVAAHAFNIPMSLVHLSDTATDKVPNSSPTAASASSDLNGAAVLDACNQISARLEPLRRANPTKSWREIVHMAYFERIGLSASGFYATPEIGYDWVTGVGAPFNYYTTGVAYVDVEVDTLTGDFTTLDAHLVMDVGVPINPTIDIGQVEGAFIQGVGLFSTEELVWGDSAHPWVKPGTLQTRGPGTYKPPTANDIPLRMHVELWKGGQNSRAIFSSKGVGEPPLFMGAAVFFAIKDALQAARVEAIGDEAAHRPFVFHSPATSERIRMAACDTITTGMMKPHIKENVAEAAASFQTMGSF